MRAAAAAGAAMINDIGALTAPGAIEACAGADVGVCLMHMQREPRTMQAAPSYGDVVTEVRDFLVARAAACVEAGIARERIAIDPGFGFGKTLAHNLALLRSLGDVRGHGLSGGRGPVAQGVARRDHRAQRRTSGCPRASRRRSARWRAAPPSCACTTCGRRSTR